MRRTSLVAACTTAAVLTAAGCATKPAISVPEVPAALRPPAEQTVFLEGLATGVQIYECAPKANQPDAYEWAFRAPEATLVDRLGRPVANHYAGPTWQAPDGSSVVGEVKARDPGPNATAIPWLLLSAKSTAGAGVMSQTRSVQRLQTVGGNAPAEACGAGNLKQVARVPYTATYYFYRSGS
jgi:Protein of unknown function (DUF3455)